MAICCAYYLAKVCASRGLSKQTQFSLNHRVLAGTENCPIPPSLAGVETVVMSQHIVEGTAAPLCMYAARAGSASAIYNGADGRAIETRLLVVPPSILVYAASPRPTGPNAWLEPRVVDDKVLTTALRAPDPLIIGLSKHGVSLGTTRVMHGA